MLASVTPLRMSHLHVNLSQLSTPGITRRSMLELARSWNEFKVSERQISMSELVAANEQGRLLESFGAGTAAVISPVNEIVYKDHKIRIPTGDDAGPLSQRMWNTLTDIQVHYMLLH